MTKQLLPHIGRHHLTHNQDCNEGHSKTLDFGSFKGLFILAPLPNAISTSGEPGLAEVVICCNSSQVQGMNKGLCYHYQHQ